MGFDINTAKPINQGFDINTAKPINQGFDINTAKPINQGFDINTAKPIENNIPLNQGKNEGIIKQFGIGYGNQMGMGLPLWALEKSKGEQAVKNLESDRPIDRIARGTGTTLGILTPAPTKIFGLGAKAAVAGVEGGLKIISKLGLIGNDATKVGKFAEKVIGTGGGAGAFQAASFPQDQKENKLISVPSAMLFGAATGGLAAKVEPTVLKYLTNKGLIQKDYVGGTDTLKDLNDVLNASQQPKDTTKIEIKNLGNQIVEKIFDRNASIQHIKENITEVTGRTVNINEDPYIAASNYGRVGSKINYNIDQLKNAIGEDKPYLNNIEQLMKAQNFKERAINGIKNPNGFDEIKSQKALDDLKHIWGDELYQKIENATTRVRNHLDNLLQDSIGTFISQDDYTAIKNKNQFYMPTEVLKYMNDNVDNIVKKTGFKASEPGALKLAQGTESDINKPMDSVINYTIKMTSGVEGQKVRQSIVNLRNLGKEAEQFIIKDPQEIPNGFSKVSVFENGIKNEYAVPKDVADVMNGLNKESIDMVTRMAGFTARALKLGATQLNIPFSIANIPRDILQAKFTSPIGFSFWRDWTKGAFEAIKHFTGNQSNLFDEFQKSGASLSGYQAFYRTRVNPYLKNITGNPISVTDQVFPSLSKTIINNSNPFNWLSTIANISEQSTRLGSFARARRMGLPLEQAAYIAANSTVDFSKMGTKMQIANQWIPFLNARTQGTVNIFKAAKDNPKRFALTAAGIIGLPTISTYLWNTKEYPEIWDSIPQYEKDNNFIVIYGRQKDNENKWMNVARIPKGDVGKTLANPIEAVLDWHRGNNKVDFDSMALKILSNLSPISFESKGQFDPNQILSSTLPPFLKAGVEAATNKNLYTGKQIIPENLKNSSPTEQWIAGKTPDIAIALGKVFNISPLILQNTIVTTLGGLGRQMLDPFNTNKTLQNRFIGAASTAEQQNKFDVLRDIVMDKSTQDAKDLHIIQQALIDFKNVPAIPELRKKFLKDTFEGHPLLIKEFLESVSDNMNSIDAFDKYLDTRSTNEKIKFMQSWANTLTNDGDKQDFIKEMIDKKILTNHMLKELVNGQKTQ